jgi:hypothetical protein
MSWTIDTAGQERRAHRAFGEWLSSFPWQWYTTHTFKGDYVSPKSADRQWYSWLNSVRVAAHKPMHSIFGAGAVSYFRVTEYQDRGVLHYHALLGAVGDLRRLSFKDLWETSGFARVEAYEPGKGANYYVGKYLVKDSGDIRFSDNLSTRSP